MKRMCTERSAQADLKARKKGGVEKSKEKIRRAQPVTTGGAWQVHRINSVQNRTSGVVTCTYELCQRKDSALAPARSAHIFSDVCNSGIMARPKNDSIFWIRLGDPHLNTNCVSFYGSLRVSANGLLRSNIPGHPVSLESCYHSHSKALLPHVKCLRTSKRAHIPDYFGRH